MRKDEEDFSIWDLIKAIPGLVVLVLIAREINWSEVFDSGPTRSQIESRLSDFQAEVEATRAEESWRTDISRPSPPKVTVQVDPDFSPSEVNCDDFATQRDAQDFFDQFEGDPYWLDDDNDGAACELLP